MTRAMRRAAITGVSAGCALLLAASPASALHCEQVSKNPGAGQAAEKESSTQGGGRSWNSGATGGFVGDTFARNLLVNGGCGGANGVYIEGVCLAGVVNPAELYKDFGIAGPPG